MPSGGSSTGNDVFLLRIVLLITVSTVFLTASFMGILAFVSGAEMNVSGRLPWYLVIGAATFVGSIVLLEQAESEGYTIIVTTIVTSVAMFILTLLAVEGVIFMSRYPEMVVNSQTILYLVSAAMVGVGLGYWGFNHWREFTRNPSQGQL